MSLFFKNKPLLDADVQRDVVACIRAAEAQTTGELRVYVESHCSYVDAMDRAVELFEKLGMVQTERRNAVLVYVAVNDHQFALAGDEQIYQKAGGPIFWKHAAEHLQTHLRNGDIRTGLCTCVQELGKAMAEHFPYDASVTRNELPDEIVFGK